MSADVKITQFGQTPEGENVTMFTLQNASGMTARFMEYGAALVCLTVPDRAGVLGDVVLGFDTLAGYVGDSFYIGAVIGRYANRIEKARFLLDGRHHELTRCDGAHHLHGGTIGFHKALWSGDTCTENGRRGVCFQRMSPDGEEGYPGNLRTRVIYWLTDTNELRIEYEAETDAATPVNLTQHTYFNLAGHDAGSILDHRLQIHADHFTPVSETLIPTGERRLVDGTPMDFRTLRGIGERINGDDKQLAYGNGYDQNWVLNGEAGSLRPVARLEEPTTGRCFELQTTQPGMQFYTGNFLDGSSRGKGGCRYPHRGGLCLETQHFPDAPNQPTFPSTILRPGERYAQTTLYRFGVC